MSPITAFPLRPARVHEACGPLAAALAAVSAAQSGGQILWLREAWRPESINPAGLAAYVDPSRLLLARTGNQTETLAVAEEGLRDGSVPLVVLELTAPLGLTAGRRLQLAAQAGQGTGLCLIPEGMGSPAAETRWHCSPLPDPGSAAGDSTLQRWRLIKNKSGTLGVWDVRWSPSARRLTVVSAARE
ncbi:protein ImuA [Paracoccus halophilus]|uniref:Protein ImuA n=1 Tax=Paracoccus halophilus TaxID=376733 RepID=A0A099F1A4_9RHOB|nr:hypothetical protein [Paracoccus halophilus]KGJ04259.1 hypothetical protein IT41_11265 [Paracoccus halophilus]SFA52187.1 protein ImuA [Paracoccus halophilus]